MTIRTQNLDPYRAEREAVHERALATQRQPRTYARILSELIAGHDPGDGKPDDATLRRYSETAKTLAEHERRTAPSSAALAATESAERVRNLDARIAELRAKVGTGTDAQKAQRSSDLTKLLAQRHRIGPTDHNGWTLPYRDDDGGEAA
jgi:hypothetical protein